MERKKEMNKEVNRQGGDRLQSSFIQRISKLTEHSTHLFKVSAKETLVAQRVKHLPAMQETRV